ncbi:MAG: hypothetical protein ACK4SY_04885 [Pyrobaculum sp.]
MSFYDFLWEAVRRPSLVVEYTRELGIELPQPPQDFYSRLKYVAATAVLILSAERGDDEWWKRRCVEVRRFYLEAAEDLKGVGISLERFDLC